MKAVIFFTDGSSLDPLGRAVGLIRTAGRELALITIEKLSKAGIGEVLLCCTAHLREVREFAESYKGTASLTVCEPEQLGELSAGERLLLLGDGYGYPAGFEALIASEGLTLLTCSEPVGSETEEDELCRRLIGEEKGSFGFAGGIALPEGADISGCGSLSEILSRLEEKAASAAVHKSFRFTDVQALCEYQAYLLDRAMPKWVTAFPERVYTADGRKFSGVRLIPPVYIGRDVTVAPGAVIGPYTSVDDNTLIERRARVEGCIIGRGAVIGAHSELKRAAVLDGASLGASVRLGEGSAAGVDACIGDGAALCAGVAVYAECSAGEGAYLCEDVTEGNVPAACIGDDGSCSFPLRTAPSSLIRFGEAVASALPRGSIAAVCRSASPGSEAFSDCLRTGLTAGGCRVLDLGEGSKPLLAFALTRCSLLCGCYVTGRAGETVSLMSKGGLPLVSETEKAIERAYTGVSLRTAALSDRSRSAELSGVRELYVDWLRRVVSGSEARLCASIRCPDRSIQRLGDEIFAANAESTGERLIFNISHDGMSCSAYSHSLGYVMHERLAMLVMKNCFECGQTVAVPLEFPSAADSLAEEEGGRLLRYFTSSDGEGDREARDCAASLDNLFIRDGLALAAFVTMITAKRGKPFEEVISEIPRFYCSQRFVGVSSRRELSPEHFGAAAVGDGAEVVRGGGRAVVRPVKGSRGFMVFSEGTSAETAASLCEEITAKLRELYGNLD